MDHFKFVISEHLNHYGTLYGGNLLKWIDEVDYIAAAVEFPNNQFVTVALDNVEFKHRIEVGAVLKFSVERLRKGDSSLTYDVKVYSAVEEVQSNTMLFETKITFVNVDAQGNKASIKH
jgi:acyl-CoA hydrolase|tara:strand:- start:9 stop:365 length:357 start_codon:yes stop_codon:yes gene_type:complete